jgi:hypothetical protein
MSPNKPPALKIGNLQPDEDDRNRRTRLNICPKTI